MDSETSLQKDVIDELADDPSVDASNIAVGVNGNVVTLQGTVRSCAERQAAERAAKRVRGVYGLADELVVDLPATHRRNDAEIISAALNAMAWDVAIPEGAITIIIADGRLTLEGEVDWQYQREPAGRLAAQLTGVRSVSNNIFVNSPVSPGDIQRKIRAAFQRSADLTANGLAVEVRGSTVLISGPVHTWGERDRAVSAAYAVPGVSKVENHTYFVQPPN
jgi:osmotically-inducible protein OsmY